MSLAFYGTVVAGLYAAQDVLVYPGAYMSPPPGFDYTGLEAVLSGRMMNGPSGQFFALHAPPAGNNPVVISFHGNGSYPEDFASIHMRLLRDGIGIVSPAYRGYPRSPGKPGEEDIHADAAAALAWVREKHPASPVIVLGHSLGTGVAVRLASDADIDGVVLLAPYLSLSSLAWQRLPFIPVSQLLRSPFRSDLAIPRVRAAILAFHGDEDNIVPVSSGRRLVDLANSPVELVELARVGHMDILLDGTVADRIAGFVARTTKGNPAERQP